MEKIQKIWKIIFLMVILNSFAYGKLIVNSNLVTIETISTAIEDINKPKIFDGNAEVILRKQGNNQSGYLGLRVTEVGRRQAQLFNTNEHKFEFSHNGVTIYFEMKSIEIIGGSISEYSYVNFDSNSDQVRVKFSYRIEVVVAANTTVIGRVGLGFVTSNNHNFSGPASDEVAEFIEINLENNGSLVGVDLGEMNFGLANFVTNMSRANLKLTSKQNDLTPKNTFVELDSQILLIPQGAVGETRNTQSIPVNISLEGHGGTVINDGSKKRYQVLGLTNSNPVANLSVVGTTNNIEIGQKSGIYKGNINIRITYTK